MRYKVWTLAATVALGACGGGGGGGGVAVPAPTPTPTPTPTPSPSPSASPAPSYTRYADLAGDQSFRTSCAALDFIGTPPVPTPVTAFGAGLTLGYTAATMRYAITGDGLNLAFGPAERDQTVTTAQSYFRTTNGVTERFTIGQPNAQGVPLDYARGFSLNTRRPIGVQVQYNCLFGVPTQANDRPALIADYIRFGVNGVAYANPGGSLRAYSMLQSVAAIRYDPAARTLAVSIRLVGVEVTAAGLGTTTVDFGTYTGTATADPASMAFSGTLTSANRGDVTASFAGSFFGPQAREVGATVSIFAADPATGTRVAFIGNAVGMQ